MTRRTEEETVRIHVTLFSSDVQRLNELYGMRKGMSVAMAIRMMVRASIKRIDEAQARKNIRPEPEPDSLPEFEEEMESIS